MKKTQILLSLSILPLGITPFIGSIVNENSVNKNDSDSDTNNVENKINISTVIPNNSDIGEISLLSDLETEPTKIQILGAINMWIQNQSASQIANWHINQVDIDLATVTTTGATIKTTSWSPDYNSSSTNVVFAIRVVNKISLRQALTGVAAGTGTINLNTYKAESLSKMTEADIIPLLGDSNKVKLLKWLDGADLYSSALYINQISVSISLSLDGATHKYKFSISTKPNSTVYTLGAVDVEFNLNKADISGFTLVKTLVFTKTPDAREVAGQFLSLNSDKLDPTKITADDLDVKNIVAGGTCTVEVKTTNPTYMTSTPINLTWTTSTVIDIKTILTHTVLNCIEQPQGRNDFAFLIAEVNNNVLDWKAEWDQFDMTISPTNSILKAKPGSLDYIGEVIFTYIPDTDVTADIVPVSSEVIGNAKDNNVLVAHAKITGAVSTDPGYTATLLIDGVQEPDTNVALQPAYQDPTSLNVFVKRSIDVSNRRIDGTVKIFLNGSAIGETQISVIFVSYGIEYLSSEITDGNIWEGSSILISDNLAVGKKISLEYSTRENDWTVSFPTGDTILKDEPKKSFVINYPQWKPISEVIRVFIKIEGKTVGTVNQKLTIHPRNPKFDTPMGDILTPFVIKGVGAKASINVGILDAYDTSIFTYTARLMDNTTKQEVDHSIFTLDFQVGTYESTYHTLTTEIGINAMKVTPKALSCYIELLGNGSPFGTPVVLKDIYLLCQDPTVTVPIVTNVPLTTATKILEVSGYDITWDYTGALSVQLYDPVSGGPLPEEDVFLQIVSSTGNADHILKFEIYATFKKIVTGTYSLRAYTSCLNAPEIFPADKLFLIHEEKDVTFTIN